MAGVEASGSFEDKGWVALAGVAMSSGLTLPCWSSATWALPAHPRLQSSWPCSFRNFDVEESHQCSLDWLMLGPAAPPRQEAFRLCGSAIPPAFISARDHVWIFFHSDASSSGQAQGFRLSYIRGDPAAGRGGPPRSTQCLRVGSQAGAAPPLAAPCRLSLGSPVSGSIVMALGLVLLLPQRPLRALTPLCRLG